MPHDANSTPPVPFVARTIFSLIYLTLDEKLFFALGAVVWLFIFSGSLWATGRPWLLKTYVFGHEMTHGLWSFAMGGRVSGMKFGEEGGYLITDTVNVWVALAPLLK